MNDTTVNSDQVVEAEDLSMNSPEVAVIMLNDKEIRKMKPEEAQQAAIDKHMENKSEEAAPTPKKEDSNLQKRGKLSAEERISEVTRARREAESRADAAEQRLKELESQTTNVKKESKVEESEAPKVQPVVLEKFNKPKPNLDTWQGSLAEFTEEITDWKLEKKDWDNQQKVLATQMEAQSQKIRDNFTDRENAVKQQLSDYDDIITMKFQKDFVDNVASPAALGYIIESDVGPEILYEIANDEAKLAGFKAMTPAKQVGYLGRLESKFEDKPEKTATKPDRNISKMVPPDKKLPKGNAVLGASLPENPTFAQYQEWRRKK